MAELPPLGTVVQLRSGSDVILAYVRGQKGARLQVQTDKRRMLAIPLTRVIQAVSTSVDVNDGVEALCQLRDEATQLAESVDIELLWEQVRAEPTAKTIALLSEVYLGKQAEPAEQLGFGFALCADRLYFKQKGSGFVPRMESEVQARLQQREQERKAQALREAFADWVFDGLSKPDQPLAELPAETEGLLEQLVEFASEETAGVGTRKAKTLLGMIASRLPQSSSVQATTSGASRLLVDLGVFHQAEHLALRRLRIPCAFDTDVLAAAADYAPYAFDPHLDGSRRDLREVPTWTIDPAETGDRDDAFSCLARPDGRYDLMVHIADAAYWVPTASTLFHLGLQRGTSLYLPAVPKSTIGERALALPERFQPNAAMTHVPMLPPSLSQSRMSLDAGSDRPAITFTVTIRTDGTYEAIRIARSAIVVDRNYAYEEADEELASNIAPFAPVLELTRQLTQWRVQAGAVLSASRERYLSIDDDGHVDLQIRDERTPARQMVAELMILTNTLAASHFAETQTPALFRVQARPKRIPARDDFPHPEVYANEMRRVLGRADVQLQPGCHATLGVEGYVQITSPIRRALDLVLQHQLVHQLEHGEALFDGPKLLELFGQTQTATGEAQQATREIHLYWLAQYLKQDLTCRYEAIVLAKGRGRFVWLDIPGLAFRQPVTVSFPTTPGARVWVQAVGFEPLTWKVSPDEDKAPEAAEAPEPSV